MIEKLVHILLSPKSLARLTTLWIISMVVSASLSASFVSNSPEIVASAELAQDKIVTSPDNSEAEEFTKQNTQEGDLFDLFEQDFGVSIPQMPKRIEIASLGIDLEVRNPDTQNIEALDRELMKGAVRYPTSALLGEKNKAVVIFGHSTQIPGYYGMYRAFNGIENLKDGEIVALYSKNKQYLYRVSKVYKANAQTDSIPLSAQNNKLILVTCNGFGKKTERWIVEADLVGVYKI